MKLCTKCGRQKKADEFYSKRNYCKVCARKISKEYRLRPENLQRQRELGSQRQQVYRARNQRVLMEFLEKNPCVECGESDPVVLELDHLDPTEKTSNVSDLMNRSRMELLMEELAKCQVMCANCHRKKTAKQFGWWKLQQTET